MLPEALNDRKVWRLSLGWCDAKWLPRWTMRDPEHGYMLIATSAHFSRDDT
jgi:hypothetical protein